MSTDTYSHDLGMISRELGTIAGALDALADRFTGRREPEEPRPPRPFVPRKDDDTYARLLAALLGFVSREVVVESSTTSHISMTMRGTLQVIEDGSDECLVRCDLGEDTVVWFDRHEVYALDTFECGCIDVLTVGCRVFVGDPGCEHGPDEEDDDDYDA
jgi:hypothetical protein